MVEETKGKAPVARARLGNVDGALWRNEHKVDGKQVKSLSATFQKSYKKGEEWKHTGSFGVNELPKLAVVAQELFVRAVREREALLSDGPQNEGDS